MSLTELDTSSAALFTRFRHPADRGDLSKRYKLLAPLQQDIFALRWRRQAAGMVASWSLVITCLLAASTAASSALNLPLTFLGATGITQDVQATFLLLAVMIAAGRWEWAYRDALATSRIARAIEFTTIALILVVATARFDLVSI